MILVQVQLMCICITTVRRHRRCAGSWCEQIVWPGTKSISAVVWMNTSRSALDRLLDPSNESVTLNTLQNAAKAIGAHLEMRLVFDNKAA